MEGILKLVSHDSARLKEALEHFALNKEKKRDFRYAILKKFILMNKLYLQKLESEPTNKQAILACQFAQVILVQLESTSNLR